MAGGKPAAAKANKAKAESLPPFMKWGAVLALLAALVSVVVPRPRDLMPPVQRVVEETATLHDIDDDMYQRVTVKFPSLDGKDMLGAWFYTPKNSSAAVPPVIVMAHGLGGQRDMGLHPYAEAFAWSGFAVLVFDYRGFSDSDGSLRNWVSPARHLEDWQAAIKYVEHLGASGTVDSERILLWGTSLAGGHVLVTAATLAHLPSIKGVVAQVPHLSGHAGSELSIKMRGILPSVRLFVAGIFDVISSNLGWEPVYAKAAGTRGSVSFMALDPDQLVKYKARHPATPAGGWQNAIPARFIFEAPLYSPVNYLDKIKAPVLLMSGLTDMLCPHETIVKAAATYRMDLVTYPAGHFDVYLPQEQGGVWEDAVSRQLYFFCKVANLDCPEDEHQQQQLTEQQAEEQQQEEQQQEEQIEKGDDIAQQQEED